MRHSQHRFPPLSTMGFKDLMSTLWFHIFVDNPLGWAFGTLRFKATSRLMGISCGNVRCYGNTDLFRAPGSVIELGDDVQIISTPARGNAASLYAKSRIRTYTPSAAVRIGAHTGMNGISLTARSRTISIGENCRIGPNVVIVDSDYHAPWPPRQRRDKPGFEEDADVTIEDNVWIGMNALILKGVTIGRNSIIGAGSVVSRDIPPDCLAAGVPARKVKDYPPVSYIASPACNRLSTTTHVQPDNTA